MAARDALLCSQHTPLREFDPLEQIVVVRLGTRAANVEARFAAAHHAGR
jgi:hypothetical protein